MKKLNPHDPAPDETPEDRWQMTDKRRDKMSEAAKDVQELIHKNPPPTFDEMEAALNKLVHEHETTRNA